MKKIIYATFDEVPSFKGASTHILSGIREAIRGNSMTLVTLGNVALPSTAGFLHRPLPIREKNYLKRGFAFRSEIEKILRAHPADVIHFRTPWEGLIAIRAGCPTVYELNGVPSIESRYHYAGLTDRVLGMFFQWEAECIERATVIICPSERIRSFILSHYAVTAPEKILVFQNAYDPPPFPPAAKKALSQDSPIRSVYLGTLNPWQGVHWALKAYRESSPRFTLDIHAPASKRLSRQIERRIRRYGLEERVKLKAPLHKSKMHEVLPDYDFAIAPLMKTHRNTEQGCFPIKLLDYLSHGLPVLASDLFVNRQLIDPNVNGWLYAPNRMSALKEALDSIENETRASPEKIPRLRRGALDSISRHWTWKDYGERLVSLYEDLTCAAGMSSRNTSRYEERSLERVNP